MLDFEIEIGDIDRFYNKKFQLHLVQDSLGSRWQIYKGRRLHIILVSNDLKMSQSAVMTLSSIYLWMIDSF